MYADFFGLRELPFNNTPDPRFFYSTPEHDEALASLIYAVKERKGFALLTGEVGAGKTLVSRMMLRHFGGKIAFASINHAIQNAADLMESVCTEFELSFKHGSSNAQLVRVLQDYLLSRFAQNMPVVLVLDEAQNLPVDAFEQLRMIGNLEADDAKLLQIIIVGQPELQQRFASQELRQLRQRVFRSFHLAALDREATEAYIRHRLQIAGSARDDIFGEDAIDVVFDVSKGLPRLINTLCDNAMLSAYSADMTTIDGPFVNSVAKQMLMSGDAAEASPQDEAEVYSPVEEPTLALYTDTRPPVGSGDLAERVIWLESRLERALIDLRTTQRQLLATSSKTRSGTAAPSSHGSRGAGAREARMSHELNEFDRHLKERLDRAARRFAELQQSVRDLPALVAKTQSVVARAETVTQIMQVREANGKQLAAKVKSLIGDVRTILDGLRSAAVRVGKDERRAKSVFERLMQQTSESQRLADELNTLIARSATTAEHGTEEATVIREASAAADDVLPTADKSDADAEMAEALGTARQSLCDLRNLARAPSDSDGPQDGEEAAAPATDRLERNVEGLLDMIQSQGA